MKHIAAYAMLVLGGNAEPTAADVRALLKELGIRADVEKLNTLIPCLKGKKLHELIAAGMGKLQAVASAPGAAGPKKVEEVVEEEAPAEEVVEKEEVDVSIGIFGDDDEEW